MMISNEKQIRRVYQEISKILYVKQEVEDKQIIYIIVKIYDTVRKIL